MSTPRPINSLRILVILGFSFGLSYLLPPLSLSASTGVVVATLVLFSFLLGFFINRALERKQMISRGTSLELLYLRRVYNICENISDKQWVESAFTSLSDYHAAVSKLFLSHAATIENFRKVSHLIYGFQPKTRKDDMVYSELLKTMRDLSFERQHIEQALVNRLSGFSWMVMLINAGSSIFLLLIKLFEPQYSPLGCALLVASILLSLDLLIRTEHLSSKEIQSFEIAYRKNLPHQHRVGE